MMDIQAHRQVARAGVLLINLGTPDAPTPAAIRRYLREFLSDDRVVDLHPFLWWPVLNGIILRTRPKKLAPRYAAIWTAQGGPLLAIGLQQAAGLAERLQAQLSVEVPVVLAMRYGNPSIQAGLAALEEQGVRRVLVLPLFPQYSASTTASALDAVFDALKLRRWLPALRTVNHYHDHPAYIGALADSVRQHWQQQGRGEHLLMSFHGIPQRYFLLGDPYYCECHKTARLLAECLGLTQDQWSLSFQSRFGREEWLKPYTDTQLAELARAGVQQLDVIAPGFAADCLETLEEIGDEYRELFAGLGGTLRYVPALNAEAAHLDALASLLKPQLLDWLPADELPKAG
ncbi:MAG: ferrochelatase [Stagnimonas sp.]|nr:ferrochelatase [Stagnimonas sp.]